MINRLLTLATCLFLFILVGLSNVKTTEATIYVADLTRHSIDVWGGDATGNVAPVRQIIGSATTLSPGGPYFVAVDSSWIYVTNGGNASIDIWPIDADGNAAPTRSIKGAATTLGWPEGIAIDGNWIYVADWAEKSIDIWPINANGNVAPSRIIKGTNTTLAFPVGSAVDADWIYVVDASGSIKIWPINANGNVAPTRSIKGVATGLDDPGGVAVDESWIYVGNMDGPSVDIWPINASGNLAPTRSIKGAATTLARPVGIAFGHTPRYVHPMGSDSGDCTNPSSPCATVQYALDQTLNRDVIKLAQGQYSENVELSSGRKLVEIQGGWNAGFSKRHDDASLTRIDGGRSGIVLSVQAKSIEIDLTISGLTLQNGETTYYGGAYVESDNADVALSFEDCIFTENHGAIWMETINNGRTNLFLDSCIITSNVTGGYGGGLGVYATSGTTRIDMQNTIMAKNTAFHNGGGIRIMSSAPTTELLLINNTITGNTAREGGGIYLHAYGGGQIAAYTANNIVWGNVANFYNQGDDIYLRRDNPSMGTTLSMSARYSDIGGIYDVDGLYEDKGGNINADPLFRRPDRRDYHLKKGSPATDTGICGTLVLPDWQYVRIAPYDDFEGDMRPGYGSMYGCDIGADEYIANQAMPWLLLLDD